MSRFTSQALIEISGLNVLALGIYIEVLQRWLGDIAARLGGIPATARPRLMLADEPTAHQDQGWADVVLRLLRDHARDGQAGVALPVRSP